MATTYKRSSPYYSTPSFGQFMDVIDYRTISKKIDDVIFTITNTYEYRPDMLAYDLYGDSGLWWVFRARNPNSLEDPLLDFRAGVTIYLPNQQTLTTDLGL